MGAPAYPGVSEASPNPSSTALGKVALGRQQQMEEAQPCHFLQFVGLPTAVTNPPAPVREDSAAAPVAEPGNPSHS